MQSDLHAVICDDPEVRAVEEAVSVARATEYNKLSDLVQGDSRGSVLDSHGMLEKKVSEVAGIAGSISASVAVGVQSSEFTGLSNPYAHLKAYESSLDEDPSQYTKVYSKPAKESASEDVVELSSDLDFEEIQEYVRTTTRQKLGFVVAQVSEDSKRQWQTFTASIEGFCWSVLMYEMAR